MKQITVNICTFNELSDEAKEVALQWWQNCNQENGYAWDSENRDTFNKFCDLFNVSINRNGNVVLSENDDVRDLTGIRLMSYLWNNYARELYKPKTYYLKTIGNKSRKSKIEKDNCCVLTGYCMDDDILQPVYNAMHKPYPGTFEDLISECVQAYETAVENDHAYQDSLEYCAETCEANEYEFTEDGNRY